MPQQLSDRGIVELFHLTLVRLLAAGPDKQQYIVKGGCNLRFFFGSPRYSEDIDYDTTAEPYVVRDRMKRLLDGTVLAGTLRSRGLTISRVSATKQTETTQRWKVGLSAAGRSIELPTKVELSHRGLSGEWLLESVDAALAHAYQVTPPLACHYGAQAAVQQKIGALALRREVQARDIFDLDLLLAKTGGTVSADEELMRLLRPAIERAWALSYADFQAQVVAYLEPEVAEQYASRDAWEAIQLRVVAALEGTSR